ncbi:response regulator [Marvinbryantia formatexigens]|nr:response regulator [Marvinbryantia formatexigens]UWO25865.1 response regulator [Marvinbryantia formatexigens DSM 14469]SDF40679.1 two-component system, response regulator YesN [Marvinbryantia formatexigens]
METNNYTVLLVDDEEEVTQIIMKKIDWEGMGFSVIGSASNGVKALELVEEYQPDVVMTDIRMPYMDGMELAGRIKAEFPTTKILLFTGFDEFEYAKEAVRLEVEEYILKPVNAPELTRVFSRVKAKLDQEISEKRNVEILQKYYTESLPLLQTNFYSTLIEGRIPEEELPKYLEDYQISFSGSCYCCLVIHTSASQVPEEMSPLLLAASVQKQVEERLVQKWQAKSFFYLGNMVLIAQLENENDVSEVTDECDRFCRYVRRIVGAVVTVGIGRVCHSVLELAQSYSGAREAVSYRGIYGAARAINIQEIVPQEPGKIDTEAEAELSNLLKAIRLGSAAEVQEAAEKYLKRIASPVNSLQQYQIHIMELVSALYRFLANNDISTGALSGDMKKLYNYLLELEPDTLQKWLTETGLSLRSQLISARSSSTKSYIRKAKEYVHSNYADETLSLDSICELLGVSNSYFSTTFKRETGKSFTTYLTDFRMEQASRMLIETNEKSYVIAKSVGYTDSNYFSYVFKRCFGVSPSKYRTEHTKE